GDKFYFHEILGFRLIDAVHGDIGIIKSVNDHGSQALFEAEKDGKELLIPISDEIIEKVDRQGRAIHVKALEGLVELYLGERCPSPSVLNSSAFFKIAVP